ncbi:MFS transporter [Salinifilum aidingensis]
MSTSAPSGAGTPTAKQVHRFQTRIGFCASGGKFCDGWILGVIGVALPLATSELGLTTSWQGLIGAASLIGLFIGGLVFGWVTDQLGRQRMFLFTLVTFLVCSALQLVVTDAAQLFAVRLVMGLAVGADYAIAGALIAEFMSKQRRGPMLAGMITWWYLGFSLSASTGVAAAALLPADGSLWRWILASSSAPAAVMLVSRIGIPESPRWLASKGRMSEAQDIAERYLGATSADELLAEPRTRTRYGALFSPANVRKTALTSLFWMAQVTPFFAIYTFLPRVLNGLHIRVNATLGEILLYLFLFVGSLVGALLINRVGRRKLLIWPFGVTAMTLLVLGVWADAPTIVVVICFIIFALFNAASSVLQMLYPSEIFPTDIRSTGIGFAAAMSRIGAAVGTFLLPIGMASWGVAPIMLLGCGVLLMGLVISAAWAPETTRLELSEASRPQSSPDASIAQSTEESF